ncbi:GDSL-like Lipase/Acylhydrolase family protein [Enhydrobacter aerosaccus]|uniref:GDSL-like Lipase/Acylhydrolase family protein n=1 Tax=Enhydrobacter aerosaccus TaxID=225324 RepID=A0A1T4RJF2_9HYPH|nr:GDSL-type esterase/lipase family protein [Enhydrobacter aerosaccus]SKA16122.1 GDSL-like Lipase/Acylhydrolase family protein [Enhydrobacter aerosaccus]
MKRRSSRHSPSLAGGLAVSFVTVVLCLLVGEVLTRVFDPEASLWRYPNYIHELTYRPVLQRQLAYDSELGWQPIPGVSGTLMDKPFTVSAEGTRAHNLGQPAATGPLILTLGDSFTEGFGVGNDETWPADLERLTGRRVLNGGVRGYGIDQMVLRAERLVPRLKPHTVVLAFIADDTTRTSFSVRDSMGKPYFMPAGDSLELRNVPVQTALKSPWLTAARDVLGYSRLLDFVMRRLGAVELWYGDVVWTGADPAVISCRLMDRFADLVRRQDVKALVVSLPQSLGWSDPAGGAAEHAAVAAVLGCATKAGLPTLDTFGPFEKEGVGRAPDSYYANYHLNVRGNALAARLIADALKTGDE